MDNQLSCPLCNMEFSDQKTPRLLTMCGHTFCQGCIQTIIVPKGENKFKVVCPEDGSGCEIVQNNINQFPKNLALLKVIDSNKSKSSFKDSSFDVSRIAKQQQIQEDDQTNQLITAIKQSQQDSIESIPKQTESKQPQKEEIKQQKSENQDQNVCLLHQKPLQIVCIVDLQRICAKCAIFGQHKGHDFKSIEQIQQDNQKFNLQLVQVYNEKQQILNRIQNKITKPDLLSILSVNKQTLSKQIKQRFKKLMDLIKNQQKKALLKVQRIFQKTQKQIDDLYRIEPQTLQKYQEWQKFSFEKLQICEKGSFEQKLKLLLIDQVNSNNNVITKGKHIIEEIKSQQDNIINKAQLFLSNISLKTNDKVFDFIQSFVQILDKPPLPEPMPQQLNNHKQSPKKQSKSSKQIKLVNDRNSDKKHSEQDLLYIDQHQEIIYDEVKIEAPTRQFMKTVDNIKIQDVAFIPAIQSKIFKEQFLNPSSKILKNQKQNDVFSQNTSRDSSFISEKCIRPTKKKLKSIKVPQKVQKILQSLYADTIDTLDLTNAELGDNIILQICQFIPGTKIKTIKFIRNKLTDDVLIKMLPFLTSVITLNLSQNNFTDRALQIFIQKRQMLPKVKSIILSMNKIIERKHKNKIQELRKLDVTVSV